MKSLMSTSLGLTGRRAGKVRDLYDLPPDRAGRPRLLIVATDRLSAFDVVLPTPIPGKGRLLTAISGRWFDLIERHNLSRTHVLSTDVGEIPGLEPEQARDLEGRVTIGRACRVVPVECVARGYLEGSGWKEYRETGAVCGVALPAGLRQGDRLPEPIFTPATKAEQGAHDENIDFDRAAELVGGETMERLREATLAIYRFAHDYAGQRGIILADTKFEFGFPLDVAGAAEGEPILVDEALTPDSSRYWPMDRWTPGGAQESFDKQFVREHLDRLVEAGRWDKRAPGPALPEEVVDGTVARYAEAFDRLFGEGEGR